MTTDFTRKLVSAYEMDEVSGNLMDSHGTNHLTPGAGVTYGDSIGIGRCIHVSGAHPAGSAQIADVDQSGLSFGTGPFSIECWFKLVDVMSPIDAYIISKYSGGGYLINIQMQDGTHGLIKTDFTGAGGFSGSTIFDNTLRHQFVVTRVGAVQKIYLDGVLDGTSSCSAGSFDNTEPFCIGTWPVGDGSKFTGPIDRVRMYNTNWNDAQVLELYNGRNGLTYTQLSGKLRNLNAIDTVNMGTISMFNGVLLSGVSSINRVS